MTRYRNNGVDSNNQLRDVELNPFAEYGNSLVHPLATNYKSVEHSSVSNMIDESGSLASKQVGELSVAQNVQGSSDCESSYINTDAPQGTYYGRCESPNSRMTYTHLSDVSDSEEEETERRPKIAKFYPSYVQTTVNPLVLEIFTEYIRWFFYMIELSLQVPNQIQNEKIVELGEDSVYERSDATCDEENVADENVQLAAEKYEVIDLTQDDDDGGMGSEQLNVVAPPSNQQLLAEAPTVEQTIQQSTLSVHEPVSPITMHTPPPVYLEDASTKELVLPVPSPIQTRGKRPYREPEHVCVTAHCSGPKQLRRSSRLESIAKKSTCTNLKRNIQPQNHQDRHKRKPENQKEPRAKPSQPLRSPRLEAEARKCTAATKKRSREPWNHNGLLRFIAQYAFSLPHHVWAERKDGEPRRSMRLAKKMQRRRYLLRPRLHAKS